MSGPGRGGGRGVGRIRTVHLIHHSHTGIGYTHDQPVPWELERRFLDEAAIVDPSAWTQYRLCSLLDPDGVGG